MGKKKEKAAKLKKKKSTPEVAVELESESVEQAEAEAESIQDVEAESESIQYAEHVTAEDVMELINTLSQDLNKLDESNRLLQQQIAQSQKAPQRQHTALNIIALVLVIGIIAVGYSSAKINSRINEHMGMNMGTGVDSTDMDKMTSHITTMDTSIESMSSDINNINTSLGKL